AARIAGLLALFVALFVAMGGDLTLACFRGGFAIGLMVVAALGSFLHTGVFDWLDGLLPLGMKYRRAHHPRLTTLAMLGASVALALWAASMPADVDDLTPLQFFGGW